MSKSTFFYEIEDYNYLTQHVESQNTKEKAEYQTSLLSEDYVIYSDSFKDPELN